ncbi:MULTISPECIES: hypothetical protein [Anaerotruncus]|uniref:hypothetical protein n=4 Tax=Oscillospiraceae TaxID=216572 RepID=UPI0011AEC417|nr:hypothetical protein [Anaerotruncus massiliensis (ex Togo et al. 2019)]
MTAKVSASNFFIFFPPNSIGKGAASGVGRYRFKVTDYFFQVYCKYPVKSIVFFANPQKTNTISFRIIHKILIDFLVFVLNPKRHAAFFDKSVRDIGRFHKDLGASLKKFRLQNTSVFHRHPNPRLAALSKYDRIRKTRCQP